MPDRLRPSGQDRHQRRKWLLSLLLPWLAATELIENSSFLFSASHVAHGLGAGATAFAWVLAAFATGSMLMVALQQSLVRHVGYRRYLLWALALFQLGALGSLWASSLWPRSVSALVVARAVQGLGAGALFTSGRILVPLLFAPAERALALQRFIRWLFAISAFGPLLAAGLMHYGGWQMVFAVPLPLSLACSLIVWACMPEGVGQHAQPAWHSSRPWAALLLLAAIALLQWALAGARYPQQFTLHHLAWPMGLALLMLAGWWWHQRNHQAPLLPWHGLRHPGYGVGLGLYGLYYLIASANGVVVPTFAERVLDLPGWQVGLLGSGGALVGWLAAHAYLRWGARSQRKPALMAGATAMMALACISLALLPAGVSAMPVLAAAVAAKGAFGSLFLLPLAGLAFRELGDEHFGPGYQIKNLLRHLMISTGIALAALGLEPGVLSQACTRLLCALGLASLVLMAWVALQQRLR